MHKSLILTPMLGLLLFGMTTAQERQTPIGYEWDGTEQQLHIWNQGPTAQDWYYEGTCGDGLSNHPDIQWERTRMGYTYGDTLQELKDNYEEITADKCNHDITTDWETAVNASAWGSLIIKGHKTNIKKNVNLGVNDEYIQEVYTAQVPDITRNDIYFVLHKDRIKVAGDYANDFLVIPHLNGDHTIINLNQHYLEGKKSIYYGNDIKPAMLIHDNAAEENIKFHHDYPKKTWALIIWERDIYLIFHATHLWGERTLKTYWVDAGGGGCTCFGTITNCGASTSYPDGTTHDVGDGFRMLGRLDVSGGGSCASCNIYWQDDTGGWSTIPTADTDIDCSGATCRVKGNSATWYTQNLDCEGAGTYGTRLKVDAITSCGTGDFYSSTQYIQCNAPATDNCGYDGNGDWEIGTDRNCTNGTWNISGTLYISNASKVRFVNSSTLWNHSIGLALNMTPGSEVCWMP